jgi:hypothetical protein
MQVNAPQPGTASITGIADAPVRSTGVADSRQPIVGVVMTRWHGVPVFQRQPEP